MKISVVGGGPGGLYFAILAKKQLPGAAITVYERNGPDDTFGFGVVFSEQTLDGFAAADEDSFHEITDSFAFWDDVRILFKGHEARVSGNGFCGCSRKTLLAILQRRARDLGVVLRFKHEVSHLEDLSDSDLIIAADGINSGIRAEFADHFEPEVDMRPNKFVWLGSTKSLDAFNFIFRETEAGRFIAHAYQYEAGASTWVIETDPATFDRAGLERMDENQSARFLEQIFADDLDGHPLLTNRSVWRSFPAIRTKRWVRGNTVLLGDAKATAHFSIGSGTKLAMEDAMALAGAIERNSAIPAALADFEASRRLDVEKIQHAADVSLAWFEHLDRFWDFKPTKFAFGLMTRSAAITYDDLSLRAPAMVEAAAQAFAEEQVELGHPAIIRSPPIPPMFQPFKLRDLHLSNRVVMSPMCMYSAKEGVPNEWHFVHLCSRALGGTALLFTEMTNVAPEARITPGCTGLYSDEQESEWRKIVNFVRSTSAAKLCIQLGHAGRKGATRLMWEGMDRPLEQGEWPIVSASPLPYYPDSQVPRPLSEADMKAIRDQFVAAAERADRIGFDMLELHCAHGYLLASFLSPLTNRRTDDYGGSLENRLRFPLYIFRALRQTWPSAKPMSVRISATDWVDGGMTAEESVKVAQAFAAEGCDLIDVSTGQTVSDAKPGFGRMFQTPFSDRIRNEAGLATMCVGNITTADQINTILAAGRADLVAIGRNHLTDPFLTMRAAAWYGVEDMACPPQYQPGQAAQRAQMRREREDLINLRQRARPRALARYELGFEPRRSVAEERNVG